MEDINQKRTRLGRSVLIWDDALARIAKKKSEHMSMHAYIGHKAPDGRMITDFFVRSMPLIEVGENVAGGSASLGELYAALLDSGSHRYTMIYPFWNRVGIAVVEKNGIHYMTQVFSRE